MEHPSYLSVQALTKYIKRKFDADPHLMNVFVKGEISNFKKHTSGHLYFTLKDDQARIMAVMFSRSAKMMKFNPENGMHVLIKGNISVYEHSGQYQIYVQEMLPDGIGELFLAYEQLKENLEKEGLFHASHKKPIPSYPQKIGIITSPTGAAIRDIMTTIQRRYPIGKIFIFPALVQGQQAGKSIVAAIQAANKRKDIDVLIVGRGGGSIEELWAFNEEPVVRAIFQSTIPVISAIGHETDVTIADFVADLRAPTPTGAAELAVPHVEELMERLLNQQNRLNRGMAEAIRSKQTQLNYLEQSYLFRHPHKIYEQKWETVDRWREKLYTAQERFLLKKMDQFKKIEQVLHSHHPATKIQLHKEKLSYLHGRLKTQMQMVWKQKNNDFVHKVSKLDALSPLNILKRGYSVAYTEEGKLIKDTDQVEAGEKMMVRVMDGHYHCTVDYAKKGEKNGGKDHI
ncbi:exodeoxyribonuclease VII large subunit [Lederbergia sp. NSJ-179]|uniref:exodeoxyribonuclease VII large subunit n=1 Tax=Lederbergia sp. NSJ-179 TaxID=2931402 RepID=UPI001FD36B53|nr:exodeoxyribonuclease VII large subunit [Lederbergia sp. NSJ-179]MCJ7839359.1 exodeoxyribonuclease VII large subunit [Lederbergia sp. NSJ-179]